MVPRKQRTPIVADTNVFVRAFKARSQTTANRRVVRLWLIERKLQLVVSAELIAEYLEIFSAVLGMDDTTVRDWQLRFETDRRATLVGLGRRYTESRDPDDNLLLATATAGRAEFLITNDLDLLELPENVQDRLPYDIVTPQAFLRTWEQT
ncbi:MAG: putative toxin-antitoxin system toxin component, PIN family [Planctomycetota bacterium]|nr:putative toxin-antitoxin system toxin component, PIN family [Planctomycetota bacterium]